ncbi:hypothetical protein [Janthinobacterium sp. B9-8]|uniref:hypothetical protein n=1 Tax=Janthinobacterium sp. B9-8 TaxID=1236179 RepID=UPI00061CE660|nr:hypothetical protein [Janthinobacterium sp. B9-8]AMC34783.1 hypothetical protein VN23_09255 [Janthinobacterium sp. B9-8]
MNRAQRRQSAKPASRFDKNAGLMAFHTRLNLHNRTQTTQEDLEILMIEYYMRLEELTKGRLSGDGFIQLVEANFFGFCLAARLHKFSANEETAQAFEPSQKDFEDAAEGLQRVGERYQKLAKFGADAEGIKAMRESLKWVKELIQVSTRDHVQHALMQAEVMTKDKLRSLYASSGRRIA